MSTADAFAFWDGVHAARPAADGPRPNARLTETVTGLPPGGALDLGCGEGGDALWLAGQFEGHEPVHGCPDREGDRRRLAREDGFRHGAIDRGEAPLPSYPTREEIPGFLRDHR